MRRFLIFATSIFLLISVFGFSFQVALAAARPVRPGHPVFPFQDFAEQARAQIVFGELDIANYYLELAFQRTEDLVVLRESEHALLAMDYLDRALDQTISAIAQVPEGDRQLLESQFSTLILNINVALDGFIDVPSEQAKWVEKLQAKIITLAAILEGFPETNQMGKGFNSELALFNSIGSVGVENSPRGSEIPPRDVRFPPGSPGAVHEFFILEGQHAELDCFACHFTGQYAGTPNQCVDCHSEEPPKPHFGEDCSACHSAISWLEVNFDHNLTDTSDCLFCHQEDVPQDHYTGQCSTCHNSLGWEQAVFNHEAVDTKDCQFCHVSRKPANHYTGQCSACHNTSNWAEVNFNHQAVDASDCKACHSGRKPVNHYSGQCSACHSTSNWSEANFNHQSVGATDCKACHSGRKPANHFDGQCSQCHSTSSWEGASFSHSFPMNHGGANSNCSKCHPSGGAKYDCYACHDKGKTINEHNEEGVSNLDNRCLDCHYRGKGGDYENDHEGDHEDSHEEDREDSHEEDREDSHEDDREEDHDD